MQLENKSSLGVFLLPTEQFPDQRNLDLVFVLKFESSSIVSECDYLRNKNAVQSCLDGLFLLNNCHLVSLWMCLCFKLII